MQTNEWNVEDTGKWKTEDTDNFFYEIEEKKMYKKFIEPIWFWLKKWLRKIKSYL